MAEPLSALAELAVALRQLDREEWSSAVRATPENMARERAHSALDALTHVHAALQALRDPDSSESLAALWQQAHSAALEADECLVELITSLEPAPPA